MSVFYAGGLVQLDLAYHENTTPYGYSTELALFNPSNLPLPWRLSLDLPPLEIGFKRLLGVVAHLAGTVVVAGGLYLAIFSGKRRK